MRGSRSERQARLRRILAVSSFLIIGGLVLLAVYKMTREVDYHALLQSLRSTPPRAILEALAATAASYAVLLANDLLALRYAGARPKLQSTLLASFCGYALGNAIGAGSLSGGAVRYRVYAAAGLSAPQVARVTIFIAVAFALGVAATTSVGLAFRAREIALLLHLPPLLLWGIALLVFVLLAVFLVFCATGRTPLRFGPMRIDLPRHRLVLVQLGITMIDIVTAATSLWVLLPPVGIDFVGFATIYAAAIGLGVLSHAPGGLGVFEAVLFYAVGTQAAPSAVAAALLAYRAIYFLLPLAIATALLAGSEIRRSLAGASKPEH